LKDLISLKNINKLPKNKEIIIICYVGHTASQVLVMLKLLGYKARVLKFGIGESPTKGVKIAGWKNYGYETS
jgi:rhodanese-related sulfurtransferase